VEHVIATCHRCVPTRVLGQISFEEAEALCRGGVGACDGRSGALLPGKTAHRGTHRISAFKKADPSHAALFADRGATLQAKLGALEASELNLSGATTGVGAAITEPVPNYVLAALGMKVVTPVAFSEAIEQGTDAPATVLEQTLATLTSGEAKVLVYNVQTTGPQTDAVLAAAKKAGIPAVPVSETLPSGLDYITWQRGVLASIAQALGH